jgi:glycosyltransferase involved in cell wall biosynthesis
MDEPLVSVIIPTFNRKDFVKGAILSAINQSYNNLEVIVVEDGFKSGVDQFIRDLDNNRIIYTSHKINRGLGASRNTGMKLARGEYIAFLDDDDRWLEDKIRLQVDVMCKCTNNKTMVYCYNAQKPSEKSVPKYGKPARGPMSDYIFQGFLLLSSSMMIKKSSLVSLGGHSEKLRSCVDHDIWMKMAKDGFEMDLVEEGLIYSVGTEHERMVNQLDERLAGIKQFFNKWRSKVIDESGIESWMKIERKYHIQTSYGIVNSFRKGIISRVEAVDYLKGLFLLESPDFIWVDFFIARFGLKFSTRVFDLIPLGNKSILNYPKVNKNTKRP